MSAPGIHRLPSVDLADERDTDSIRAALSSGDTALPTYDLASLIKSPDKLKKACRAGISMVQRKEVWRSLIDLQTKKQHEPLDYLTNKLEVFNGITHPTYFPHIPDFGSTMKWNETYIHLTHKRIDQAKTILCVLASTHATITHCPFLPDLTCVLLIFFDEATVYDILERMLERSRQDEFYFTTNGANFLKWMKTFAILLEQKNAPIVEHMAALKLDPSKVFQVWMSRFFMQYMPVRTVFRIIDCFLCEGNKILFRVSLAVFKLYTKDLLACKTQHDFLVKLHSCMTKQTANDLLSTGFDIYLSRSSHMGKIKEHLVENADKALVNPPNSKSTHHFHLPRFSKEHDHVSEIIDLNDLYSLWAWLPPSSMICDPVLLYSSSIHGYSYHTLWNRACESTVGETTALFLLMKDMNGQVLGLYLHKPLPDPPEMRGRQRGNSGGVSLYTGASNTSSGTTTTPLPLDPSSFLFILKPYTEVYKHHVHRQAEHAKQHEFKKKQERITIDVTNSENSKSHVSSTSQDITQPSDEHFHPFKPYGMDHLQAPLTNSGNDAGVAGATSPQSRSDDEREDEMSPKSSPGASPKSSKLKINILAVPSAAGVMPGGRPNSASVALGPHTPNPTTTSTSSHHHKQQPHPLTGLNSHVHAGFHNASVAQSSHSMMVGPSRPVNKNQPLNELFGSLETHTPKPRSGSSSGSGTPGHTTSSATNTLHQQHAPSKLSNTTSSKLFATPSPSPYLATSTHQKAFAISTSSANHSPRGASHSALHNIPSIQLNKSNSIEEEDHHDGDHEKDHEEEKEQQKSTIDILTAAEAALSVATRMKRAPSLNPEEDDHESQAMLLMTEEGFGIVETDGIVLFVSGDLKSGISGTSSVFSSPSFTQSYKGRKSVGNPAPGGSGASPSITSTLQRCRFSISTIEVWSFVVPGSDALEQLSPRLAAHYANKTAKETRQAIPTISDDQTSHDRQNVFGN